MTRIVIDTNVLVSAAIKERGAEATVLDLVATGHLALFVSEAILLEYQNVLLRPRLKLDPGRVRNLLKTRSQLRRLRFASSPWARPPEDAIQ